MAILFASGFACAAYIYLTTPDVRPLRSTNPSTTAFIELRVHEALVKGERPRRIQKWVPYERIGVNLKRAVLVTEDSAFWDHEGVDVEEMRKSIETNLARGEFARGGSTITQQLAKNLYLSPSKNPLRKVRELFITRRLEAELSKSRILELYLNVIEWGDGIYGAEAAARTYFGKPASALAPDEAALLAAAIANPRILSPAHPTARLRQRQRMVMARMGSVTPPPPIPVPEVAPVASEPASEPPDLPGVEVPVESAPAEEPPTDPEPLPRG